MLIVEDNRDAADSLQMLLELSGCEVRVAYTGPDGVAAAMEMVPDLVICDIGLPGISGYEVARRIRAAFRGGKPVLVALTGYGEEERPPAGGGGRVRPPLHQARRPGGPRYPNPELVRTAWSGSVKHSPPASPHPRPCTPAGRRRSAS